ncbi:MAG: SDR family NAD(P)-dependent oxidoreductase [Acidimicrobiia bacterium]
MIRAQAGKAGAHPKTEQQQAESQKEKRDSRLFGRVWWISLTDMDVASIRGASHATSTRWDADIIDCGRKATMAARTRRVSILCDTQTHMMPALAHEMASRDHDLVLGDAKDGLAEELQALGATVEVVPDTADLAKRGTVQKLVDRAQETFGGFDSACIRPGAHGGGSVLSATEQDLDDQVNGNFKSVVYALQALLPPLVDQGSGQVVINTSASAVRPVPFAAIYSATRAAANSVIRAAGLQVGPNGVTVNGTGTYAMDYPSFLHDVGADTDPAKRKAVEDGLPTRRLVQPEDAAYFVAGLIDGKATGQTAQFFTIDAGWSYM